MSMEQIVDICKVACVSSVANHLKALKQRRNKQQQFESQPHELLCKIILESETLENKKDPAISKTIEYLEELHIQTTKDADLKNQIKLLRDKLKKSFDWYVEKMKQHCFVPFFNQKEKNFPGFTMNYIRGLSFKQALDNDVFRNFVNKQFDPSMQIIRCTARGLSGLKTYVKPIEKKNENEVNDYEINRSLENSEFELEQTESFLNNIIKIWTESETKLKSFGLHELNEIPRIETKTIFESVHNTWSNFAFALENTVPFVNPPETTMEESVISTVAALLTDWSNLLDRHPTKEDLQLKLDSQEKEMFETIADKCNCEFLDNATDAELEHMRALWIQTNVQDKLLPLGSQALFEVNAPTTYLMFSENVYQLSKQIIAAQQGCRELDISTKNLQTRQQEAALLPTLPNFDKNQHITVQQKWQESISNAIRIDTAFYILYFLKLFKLGNKTLQEQKNFVNEQIALKSLTESFRKATMSMESCMHQISVQGSLKMKDNFIRNLKPSVINILNETDKVYKELCQSGEEVRLQRQTDALQCIQDSFKNSQTCSNQLSSTILIVDGENVLNNLQKQWVIISNDTHNVKKEESQNSFLYHLQRAIQECDVFIQQAKLNNKLLLKQMINIANALVNAKHLLWSLKIQKS